MQQLLTGTIDRTLKVILNVRNTEDQGVTEVTGIHPLWTKNHSAASIAMTVESTNKNDSS